MPWRVSQRRGRRAAVVMLALSLAAPGVGCAPADDASRQPEYRRIKVSDLRSAVTSASTAPSDRAPPMAIVEQLDLPINESIDEAWRLTSDEGLDPHLVAAWHINGIRAGTIALDRYLDFVSVLPARRGMLVTSVITNDEFIPLGFSPPTEQPLTLAYVLPDEDETQPRTRVATPGPFRFLLRLSAWTPPQAGAGLRVDLVPHHHVPRISLKIRDGLETQRDGWAPAELTLVARLTEERLLVLAPSRSPQAPRPAPAERARLAASQPASTQPAGGAAITDDGFVEHPRLGDLILRSRRTGRPVQVVAIMGLLPRAATQPAPR